MLLQLPIEGTTDISGLIGGSITQPIVDLLQPYLVKLSYLAGLIVVLYIVLIVYRIYAEHKKVKLLEAIRYDLDHLNAHFGVTHSRERKGFFGKIWAKLAGEKVQNKK